MDERKIYRVVYNYKNVPKILRKPMQKWFMKNREKFVTIFNNNIDVVNKNWKQMHGSGKYMDPKYVKYVKNSIQPKIDVLINRKSALFKCKIDDDGDMIAHIPFIKNSKLWITLLEMKES